jgi:hypothetical protein
MTKDEAERALAALKAAADELTGIYDRQGPAEDARVYSLIHHTAEIAQHFLDVREDDEARIRRIIREEISRVLEVMADEADRADTYGVDHIESVALGSIESMARETARRLSNPDDTLNAAPGELCTVCRHPADRHKGQWCQSAPSRWLCRDCAKGEPPVNVFEED